MIKKILIITISILLLFTSFSFAEEFNNDSPSKWVIEPLPIEKGEEDTKGNAIIYDEEGTPLSIATICVTPYEDKKNAPLKEIEEDLDRAYFRLNHALSASELVESLGVELKNAKNERPDDFEIQSALGWDMVISDIFDISILGDEKELLQDGNKIVFKIKAPLKEDELWFLIHNYEGDKWEYVKDASIEGSVVTCTLESLSCLAFVRIREMHLIWPESLLMLILLLLLVLVKRKKDRRREMIEEMRAKKEADVGLIKDESVIEPEEEPIEENEVIEEIDNTQETTIEEETNEDMNPLEAKSFNELLDEFESKKDED